MSVGTCVVSLMQASGKRDEQSKMSEIQRYCFSTVAVWGMWARWGKAHVDSEADVHVRGGRCAQRELTLLDLQTIGTQSIRTETSFKISVFVLINHVLVLQSFSNGCFVDVATGMGTAC